MNFLINRSLFAQTSFTSTSPAGLACVVHAVAHEGEHEVHLLDDSELPIETIAVMVTSAPPPGAAPREALLGAMPGSPPTGVAPAPTLEINAREISAARLRRAVAEPAAHRVVQPGTHLVVNTPESQDARRVRLVRKTDGAVVFDSASLGSGDRFAVTLIRPGRYQIENQLDGKKLALTVEYPAPGKQPYRPPPPMQIECTAAGLQAPATTIKPAQGVIVVCSVPSRLHVELVEPDDGPDDGRRATAPGPAAPRTAVPAHDSLTEEARAVLRRVLRTFIGKRDDG
jgi:hypothetical protein